MEKLIKKNEKTDEKKNTPSFLFKVIKNDKTIQRYQTRSKRRFYNRVRTINWRNNPSKVYLRVNYGRAMTVQGKMANFWNDGYYETKEDFWGALKAFLE
jgi:hypothetical protein